MSEDHEFAGDTDILAGEYVLGCLDAAEMRAVEMRAAGDPRLQQAIQIWMARFAPLTATVRPLAPPPALWSRLAAAVGDTSLVPAVVRVPEPVTAPTPMTPAADQILPPNVMPLRAPRRPAGRAGLWRNTGFWRGSTALATAIAAGLAAFILMHSPESARTTGYMATLMPPNTPSPGFMAHSEPDGSIMLASLGPPPPEVPNRDMELWALPPGYARPVSLGVMPARGMKVNLHDMPRDQTQLMISLEPAGGSPSGTPTGPVLYAGKLASLN